MSENRSLTLAANTNDQVVFSFDSLSSNSMKSSNPNSGCRQVEVAKTLDTTTQDPSKNQGGVAVVYPLEGNGVRESHRGPGYSESDKMFTLNTVERHLVAYCIQGNMVDRETKQGGSGIYTDRSCTLTAVDRHAVAYDAYQHHNWRESETIGPLTTHGNGVRGDTPLVADMSVTGGQIVYENHAQDYRIKQVNVSPTIGTRPTTNPTLVMESIPKEVMSTTGGAECLRNRERTDSTVEDAGQSRNAELYARSDSCYAETCGGRQTVGSLCAHDGRGFNGQDVANDKLIIEHYETDNDS